MAYFHVRATDWLISDNFLRVSLKLHAHTIVYESEVKGQWKGFTRLVTGPVHLKEEKVCFCCNSENGKFFFIFSQLFEYEGKKGKHSPFLGKLYF